MQNVKKLDVTLGDRNVGTLVNLPNHCVGFQYDIEWVADGFSLNPYRLPLSLDLQTPDFYPFNGLFGAFHDSLPDGWGLLLLERLLRHHGLDPTSIGQLTRLAVVGDSGRGALCYHPHIDFHADAPSRYLDEIAAWCADVLADAPVDDLDAMYSLCGSSGGARPKANISLDGQSWIVKFRSSTDPEEADAIEYAYSLAAAECGITMPETRLFPSNRCEGYFGTMRFDRLSDGKRRHMLSASAIVEVTHHMPCIDYETLFQISCFLTGGMDDAKRLFRLMCFNVFSHNLDDHSNNFTWMCDDGVWSLSPGYDLTYSQGYLEEHATSVLGNSKPEMEDLLKLGKQAGLSTSWSRQAAKEIQERCVMLLDEVAEYLGPEISESGHRQGSQRRGPARH